MEEKSDSFVLKNLWLKYMSKSKNHPVDAEIIKITTKMVMIFQIDIIIIIYAALVVEWKERTELLMKTTQNTIWFRVRIDYTSYPQ